MKNLLKLISITLIVIAVLLGLNTYVQLRDSNIFNNVVEKELVKEEKEKVEELEAANVDSGFYTTKPHNQKAFSDFISGVALFDRGVIGFTFTDPKDYTHNTIRYRYKMDGAILYFSKVLEDDFFEVGTIALNKYGEKIITFNKGSVGYDVEYSFKLVKLN